MPRLLPTGGGSPYDNFQQFILDKVNGGVSTSMKNSQVNTDRILNRIRQITIFDKDGKIPTMVGENTVGDGSTVA
jgi:hypothetical protein